MHLLDVELFYEVSKEFERDGIRCQLRGLCQGSVKDGNKRGPPLDIDWENARFVV